MALQFNPWLLSPAGILAGFNAMYLSGSTQTIRIYPDTVSFPATRINNSANLPAGHIITFSNLTHGISGNYVVITAGTTTQNTTAAGTFGWFAHIGSNADYVLVSNSINTAGNGAILSVSTLTPTNGQSVSISYSFRFI